MMVLESIFGRTPEKEGKEDFIEIETGGEERGKISVRIETLNDYRDVELVQKLLREGSIVFLKIKGLREKDLGELKRSIERLKKTSRAMSGDIVGVDENYLVLTPNFARIYRGEEQPETEQ